MSFSLQEILEKRAEIFNESDTLETVLIDSEKVLNPPIRKSSLRERIFSRHNSDYLEIGNDEVGILSAATTSSSISADTEIVQVENDMNNIILTKLEDLHLAVLIKKKYYFLSIIIVGGLFVLNDYLIIKHYH